MILLAHPFGNANVRALLRAFDEAGLLASFVTTLGWSSRSRWLGLAPPKLGSQLQRRIYDLPPNKIKGFPRREVIRLLAQKAGNERLIEHERGRASVDQICRGIDILAAGVLRRSYRNEDIRVAYAYEDCAERLFETGREIGVRRIYDLPIAYWQTSRRLLEEEARRYPDWICTLTGLRDSEEKLSRKTRELELAELVICPSAFVLESLPASVRTSKPCLVAAFGSPVVRTEVSAKRSDKPLQVLFAGALTQRKGLADLFEAMKLIDSKNVELVVMGSLLCPLEWYRERLLQFRYERPRSHSEVLQLMKRCDLFVLPSIVEGRALVQQEAMACGLPLIATKNAGGDDLIMEGETGFSIPIRAPAAIAEKINWFAANRSRIAEMAVAAQRRASQLTWEGYGGKVIAAIRSLTGE